MFKRGLLLVLALCLPWLAQADEEKLSPYWGFGSIEGGIEAVADQVAAAAQGTGLTVVGRYHPAKSDTLMVVAVTAPALQAAAKENPLRGFAAVLKVGLQAHGEKVSISAIDPEYLMRAYLQKDFAAQRQAVLAVGQRLADALVGITGLKGDTFGGSVETEDLADYHYMFAMPYFEDVVELATFPSLREGIDAVRRNLAAGKDGTVPVFEVALPGGGALFGVGLHNAQNGEPHFLPIIGTDHVAAMPYELLVTQYKGKARALMLHGRYRIALHWPALTMGTFTKIMSTPGDIEEALKGLTK